MNVLDARVHLHEHDETRRGGRSARADSTAHRSRVLHPASGEGYGASHAINEAKEVLERQIRDKKTYGQSKEARAKRSGRNASAAGCSRNNLLSLFNA